MVVGILEKDGKYLLISSKKDFGENTGRLYPPGGHCEGKETEEECLKREFKEELGIEVNPMRRVAETSGDVPNQITYWWEVKWVSGEITIRKEDNVGEFVWMSPEEIQRSTRLWPATERFFGQYLSEGRGDDKSRRL